MQIYSKSMKNATSPLFRNHNRSALLAGTYITHRVIYYPLVIFGTPYINFDLKLCHSIESRETSKCTPKKVEHLIKI